MSVQADTSAAADELTRSLAQVIAERAAEQPDAVAIEDGQRRLTYAELERASTAIAAGLRAAGAEEEEVVGVCLPRSWQAICAFLGILRAGAAYLPIGPGQPAQRRRRLLELAGARRLLTRAGDPGELPAGSQAFDVEAMIAAGGNAEPPPTAGGDRLAYLLFTSGSTGEPKGVEITHANLSHVLAHGGPLVPDSTDTVLGVAPVEFDISALETWGALVVGAKLVLAPAGRPDPRALGRLIAEREVTYAFFAAGLFAQVAQAALPDLAGLRLVAAAGDVMSPAAAASIRQAHPNVRVLNGYGPTETSIVASYFEVDEVDGSPLPIGRPLRGYSFHILDPDGDPVPAGSTGELWIGGPGVGRGYRGEPERSADRFRPDPFAEHRGGRMYGSGDLVRLRKDGELLFLGRLDDQVKIAGHRIEPGEVEQALGTHPDVRHAAVIAREDVAGHKRLIGYAVLREGAATGAPQLMEHLAERLPAYMLPATIELLAELPLTARGKVDRKALPAPGRSAGEELPEGTVRSVAETMADLLGLDRIGPDEDFFSLGADSLLAIHLVGRLRELLDAELDINAVFEGRTARQLAATVETSTGSAAPRRPPLRPATEPDPAPASFAQRRAWLHERIDPDSLAFQFACVIHFEGALDTEALAKALGDLMRRHAVLRSSIVERGGELVQIVQDDVPLPLETIDLRGESGIEWARLVRERVRTRIELAQAPLVRWTLVRRGEQRWSLVDVEHHAVHDGWSFMIVLDELAALYSARADGRDADLPEATIQLGDFARWERSLLGGELERRQLDHWCRTLDPDPPLLELPAERPRPQRESFAGGSVRRRFDPALARKLRSLANEEGATSFMACLAAFALLLSRLSRQDRVQIGSGLANRSDPAAGRLVGMTVATVALPIDVSGDPSVREILRRVRRVVLDAVANSDVPFERVVEALAPPRRPGRSPLVQTLFSFDDAPAGERRWAGVEATVVQTIPNGTAKADLNVIGVDHGDGAPFFIWEHSDLLSDADADRLAGHHLRLLEQFVARPDARLSELDLLSGAERLELERWSTGGGSYDREATIPSLVEDQARCDPGAIAVIDGSRRLTYGELLDRARGVAANLRGRGVERGDRVGVLLGRCLDSPVAQLGILLAGAAYLPLDPQHPAARITRTIADAGASIVLTDAELRRRLPVGVAVLGLSEAAAETPASPVAIDATDLAYVIYTSGSTGEPKGVEVTHRNIVRLVDDPDYAELGAGTAMLHAASPAFDAATLEIWGPLANGGTIVCLGEQPSPDAVAEAIGRHGITTMWLTAGLFHELVDRRPECLSTIRQVLSGGDVLSPDHVRRALAALPPDGRLTNGYGPTETTTFAATHELRPGDPIDGPIPLGRPIQGTVCRVLDQNGNELPVGMEGELAIGGDGVARGYHGDPELTAARFRLAPDRPGDRYHLSGDQARRRPDGALEFLGRSDRQLKVRGVRVEPAEVESALRAHPELADAAVAPFERVPGDLALAAYVVPTAGSPAPGPTTLRAHAATQLPTAMVPTAWISLPELPLTANGKLDRDRLPAPGEEHLAREEGDTRPRTTAERRIIKCFEEVLGVESVGVEDDFFALGGHSLLAVTLFGKLERIGGKRLPLSTIFEAPTPRALAALIGSEAPAARWDNLIALKPQGSRPPLFAVTAGDGNIVGFAPLARHMPAEQPFYALQPSGLDGRRPLDSGIEAMATRYLAALRRVQPHGPYLLAGRCNGATVAYEMAQQLRAAGEEVPLLAALDSSPPAPKPRELAPGVPYDTLMEGAWVRARERGEEVPDLDAPGGRARLAEWLRAPLAAGVSRYLHEFWHWRDDLRKAWPDPLGADAADFLLFAWTHAREELVAAMLPPLPIGCPTPDGEPWDWAMAAVWEELSRQPADPLSPRGWRAFRARLGEPVASGKLNRYLLGTWSRPDLKAAFPQPLDGDADAMLAWAWLYGIDEGLAPQRLPAPPSPLPPRRRLELALLPARAAAVRNGARAARGFRWLSSEARLHAIGELERRLGRPLPGAGERTIQRALAAARRASADYRADPWPGRVVLIVSNEFEDKSSYLGWQVRARGGVERHHLPCGHVEMLREPGAALLARCLEERIAEALGR